MSITQTLSKTITYEGPELTQVLDDNTQIAGKYILINEAIPIAGSDVEVAIDIVALQLKLLMITCDQEVSINTNSPGAGAPDDTFQVGPISGVLSWGDGESNPNPVTVDITANVFVDNGSGTDIANLEIRALVDPTV
jgi:hypothetical protein